MNESIDVTVIGAGIHGAWTALAAAAAGYRVRVLEQYGEPATGTSSRSSKLVHGGLRYLETGQFRLVRECLRERAILLRIAPALVQQASFHIPVYRQTRRRPVQIRLGLLLYSLFSRTPFHTVPRQAWRDLDGLVTEDLEAVFAYRDALTDDVLLTRAVLATAQNLGVEVLLDSVMTAARLQSRGCVVEYTRGGSPQQFDTRVLVNTAGPWVNEVAARIEPAPPRPPIDLVQGTHIVLPGRIARPYYLEAPQDRRAVFVRPWKEKLLAGTTETRYDGDPANVRPLEREIDYLLTVCNHYFRRDFAPGDVIEAFAGLRVLPGGEGDAYGKSRDTRYIRDRPHKPRVVSVYGGKLTAARAAAEQVIDRIRPSLPARAAIADTRHLPLADAASEIRT